jgi:hypothetical protein
MGEQLAHIPDAHFNISLSLDRARRPLRLFNGRCFCVELPVGCFNRNRRVADFTSR